MKSMFLSMLLTITAYQSETVVQFLLNGQVHEFDKSISISEFEGSYIQLQLIRGSKVDPSLPLSGEIFIRSNKAIYMAPYISYFENLEEKIYLYDSIQIKSNYKIRKGDLLLIRMENVDSNQEIIYSMTFIK